MFMTIVLIILIVKKVFSIVVIAIENTKPLQINLSIIFTFLFIIWGSSMFII